MAHEHPSGGEGGHRSHLLVMALGCLIPVLLLVALFFTYSARLEGGYLLLLFALACPLVHLLLMLPRRKDAGREVKA